MSRECIIEFRQNGAQLDLDVQALAADIQVNVASQFTREQLRLPPEDLDVLRSGTPSAEVLQRVTDAVSRWLLLPDLDLPQLLNWNANVQPPWRLVFSSQKVRDETLRQGLAEVPIELVHLPGSAIPLALHGGVGSIVHRLPKIGASPLSPTTRNWPLRVLLVRSNPADLGGLVPAAEPIRTAILQAIPNAARGRQIEVDVLSSELPGGLAGRPTAEQLFRQVVKPYDMLIYLGHGDLQQSPTGGPPLGVLLLETEDGQNSKQVDARQLSALLHANPIPVVLLVGCLTAAEVPAATRQRVDAAVPGWIRGSQGVAQALVNGQSGVHFVVGMRFKVEDQDAVDFLKEFFEKLLSGPKAGDLEAALQGARRKLHFDSGGQSIGWAAPVVFRTHGEEPTFPYLATPPQNTEISPIEKDEKVRSDLWQMLCQINMQLREKGLHDLTQRFLDTLEGEYFASLAARGSLLVPDRCVVDPNLLTSEADNAVQVLIRLRNPLQFRSMEGVVGISGGRIVSLETTAELDVTEAELFSQPPKDNRIKFHLENDKGQPIPDGPMMKVNLLLPKASQVTYLLTVSGVRTQPPAPLCSLSNAVMVPPP